MIFGVKLILRTDTFPDCVRSNKGCSCLRIVSAVLKRPGACDNGVR